MKILLKRKDGTTEEITMEQARQLMANKEATLDTLKCGTEKVVEEGKEYLNIYAPNLGKLGRLKEPNKEPNKF
jgi:hypothetical protein